jgi:predicted RNA-binding Zn-ribbon protein involved in translation (DUF1610 family)
MKEPTTLAIGDACPACGDELVAARVPTVEQYRKAFDKENPVALQPGMDTAAPDARAELGVLHTCRRCGYRTRFKDQTRGGGKRSRVDES